MCDFQELIPSSLSGFERIEYSMPNGMGSRKQDDVFLVLTDVTYRFEWTSILLEKKNEICPAGLSVVEVVFVVVAGCVSSGVGNPLEPF